MKRGSIPIIKSLTSECLRRLSENGEISEGAFHQLETDCYVDSVITKNKIKSLNYQNKILKVIAISSILIAIISLGYTFRESIVEIMKDTKVNASETLKK